MALSTASLVATAAATTAAETATTKTTALLAGILAALQAELGTLTPQQQNHATALAAEVAANIATFVTALEVA